MSSDDDELLMATSFSFKKRMSSNFVIQEEAPQPQVNMKAIIGEDPEKDAYLASDDFWNRFTAPTQEEILLQQEQAERAEEDEESDEDDEADDDDSYNSRIKGFIWNVASENEPEIYESLQFFFPFHHSGNWQNLAVLMESSLFPDLLAQAELAASTRKKLFETVLQLIPMITSKILLNSLLNCAKGLFATDQFSYELTKEFVVETFSTVGVSLQHTNELVSVDSTQKSTAKSEEKTLYDPIDNLSTILEIFLLHIQKSLKGDEDMFCWWFQSLVPLLFDPAIMGARLTVQKIVLEILKAFPWNDSRTIFKWIEPLKPFLTQPSKRIVTLCRIFKVGGAERLVAPILDYFLEDLLPPSSLSPKTLPDDQFVSRAEAYLNVELNEEPRDLRKLCNTLTLASLRLMTMNLDDIPSQNLTSLKQALSISKESIPSQPFFNNIRAIDLLSKMQYHLETYLRSKGIGVYRAGTTKITDHFPLNK